MTKTNNDIPIYAEQITINEEVLSIQQILNQFKQPVPAEFIQLKVEGGNCMSSTNSKWKDKPACERYGFYLENNPKEWIQLDISHTLLETLEIEKGEDITYPLYVSPKVLKKETIRGAKTIENEDEEEIFIDKPVSEKGVERALIKRLRQLEELREKVKGLEQDKQTSRETIDTLTNERDARPAITLQQYQNLNAQLTTANNTINQNNSTISSLTTQLSLWTKTFPSKNATQVQTRISDLEAELNTANSELSKEKGWWDKWFNYQSFERCEPHSLLYNHDDKREIINNYFRSGAVIGNVRHFSLTIEFEFSNLEQITVREMSGGTEMRFAKKIFFSIYEFFRYQYRK